MPSRAWGVPLSGTIGRELLSMVAMQWSTARCAWMNSPAADRRDMPDNGRRGHDGRVL